MAKAIFDPKSTFMNLITQGAVGESEPLPQDDDSPAPGKKTLPKETGVEEKIAVTETGKGDQKEPEKQMDPLTRKTFYITKRQYRALRMRVAISDSRDEKDTSMIVRAALDLYFNEETHPARV
jgi:hypothetical protein